MAELMNHGRERPTKVVRSLTLAPAVLYGLGVTVGTGVYVLVGAAAGQSSMHAPLAFLGAAVVMGISAVSFAELDANAGRGERGRLCAGRIPT